MARNTIRVNKRTLQRQYNQWLRGDRSKMVIEREDYGNTTARGGLITRLWSTQLGLSSTRAVKAAA